MKITINNDHSSVIELNLGETITMITQEPHSLISRWLVNILTKNDNAGRVITEAPLTALRETVKVDDDESPSINVVEKIKNIQDSMNKNLDDESDDSDCGYPPWDYNKTAEEQCFNDTRTMTKKCTNGSMLAVDTDTLPL